MMARLELECKIGIESQIDSWIWIESKIGHLVICRSVITLVRSFIFSLAIKMPMKLMKANSTNARKTMMKQKRM